MSIVLVEGRELDEESFSRLTSEELACGCFRCGGRIAIHLDQLAYTRLLHEFKPTIILVCAECKADAGQSEAAGVRANTGTKFPDIKFDLSK